MSFQLPSPVFQFIDQNGNPLSGGKVNVYVPETTTPVDSYPTYADAVASTNANTNPVILNSAGFAPIFTNTPVKLVVTNSDDVTLYTIDDLQDPTGSGSAGSVGTTQLADGAVTTVKIATGAVTADKIGASAVTTVKIDNLAVTAAKLGTDAVETAKIQNGAVSTAKMADNAIDGSKIAMGSDAQGDLLFYGGTDYERLPPGTSGQQLQTAGAGADPAWGDTAATVAFHARVTTATRTNVSGDGTDYTLTYDLEQYDFGNDFSIATGIFTAPVDGVYNFTVGTAFSNVVTGIQTICVFQFIISSVVQDFIAGNDTDLIVGTPVWSGAVMVFLSAGDTARVVMTGIGGAKVLDIDGTSSPSGTSAGSIQFSGALLAAT